MIARLSQSLPCARAALLAAPLRQPLLLHHTTTTTTTTLPLASSPCLLRNTYATAATAAAVARAAEKRRAPRSYTRAPTPPPTKTYLQGSRCYLVRRTASLQLPVYRKLKSGKTREVIIIKNVNGNRLQFLEDIKAGLAVAPDKIRLNPTTQQIELQGNYYIKTKDWLVDKGF
ncbi:hypothetical protein MY11210_000180 [Beauveria gryllotalpidicola]